MLSPRIRPVGGVEELTTVGICVGTVLGEADGLGGGGEVVAGEVGGGGEDDGAADVEETVEPGGEEGLPIGTVEDAIADAGKLDEDIGFDEVALDEGEADVSLPTMEMFGRRLESPGNGVKIPSSPMSNGNALARETDADERRAVSSQ